MKECLGTTALLGEQVGIVYLGEQVETAKVTNNTVDFRETFAFSIRLQRKGECLFITYSTIFENYIKYSV